MRKEYKGHSKKSGVYRITNTITKKVYIGSCACFQVRASQHQTQLATQRHHNKHLQHSFNKHGTDAFLFEVLEVVEGDKLARTAREQAYFDSIIRACAWEDTFNFKKKSKSKEREVFSRTPEESSKKLSDSHKKLWQDPAYRARMLVVRKEASQRPEYRAKQAAIVKERWKDDEYREKQLAAMSTEEATKKSVESRRKLYRTDPEARKSMQKTQFKKGGVSVNLGKKHSKERRVAASKAKSGKGVKKRPFIVENDTIGYKFDYNIDAVKLLGLDSGHIIGVLSGRRKSHKGWTMRYLDGYVHVPGKKRTAAQLKAMSEKLKGKGKKKRTFIVENDAIGYMFNYVCEATKELGFPSSQICRVLNGKRKTHKGYRIRYM